MRENSRGDLTQGTPLLVLLRFCIPVIIGNIFQTAYNMVDSVVVGRLLGAGSLAAIGATASTTGFLLNIAFAVATAYSIVLSQNFGAQNEKNVRTTVATAIYTSTGVSLLIMALGFFGAEPLMKLLGTPAEIRAEAVLYIRICVGFGFGQVAYNGVSAVLRSIGDSRTPLYFLIASSILNVVLDLLFVSKCGMGIGGAAFATVISQTLSAAACVVYMLKRYPVFRLKRQDFLPDWHNIALTLRMASVISMQMIFTIAGEMVVTAVVNSFGTAAIAANTACGRTQHLAVLLSSSIANTFSVFVGQNLGAQRMDRVRQGLRQTALLVTALGVLSMVLLLLFGQQFVRLFIDPNDPHLAEVLEMSGVMMRITAFFVVFLGLTWLYNGTLRGAGDTKASMFSGWVELIVKCGGAVLLSHKAGWMGMAFANPLSWMSGMIPVMIIYYRGKWTKYTERILE